MDFPKLGQLHQTTLAGQDSKSYTSSSALDLFLRCWRHQSCHTCLSDPDQSPCSWCAISQVCVPNTRFPWPFEIFVPVKYEDVCPLAWREKWEMRARPFSCRASSMTVVSVLVAFVATLIGVLVLVVVFRLGRWGVRRWRKRRPGWWRVGRPVWLWRGVWDIKKSDRGQVESTDTERTVESERTRLLD